MHKSKADDRHTSVVVFDREIFFGQGVLESVPGKTHHGQPVQIIDCGTTEIDQDTFNEYLLSLQDMYSPEAYHLIEFNCNHFTADVVGFLTGGTIPAWISGESLHYGVSGAEEQDYLPSSFPHLLDRLCDLRLTPCSRGLHLENIEFKVPTTPPHPSLETRHHPPIH